MIAFDIIFVNYFLQYFSYITNNQEIRQIEAIPDSALVEAQRRLFDLFQIRQPISPLPSGSASSQFSIVLSKCSVLSIIVFSAAVSFFRNLRSFLRVIFFHKLI